MTGSLSGVRVIDMTTVYSGPMAASILGDQGADVVKVEPPGGDMQRGPMRVSRNGLDAQFAALNRNKRSIGIDLSGDVGQVGAASLCCDGGCPDGELQAGCDGTLGRRLCVTLGAEPPADLRVH